MGNSYHDQVKAGELHGWHVYVVHEDGDVFSKIGSALSVKYRTEGLRNGNPRSLTVVRDWHFTGRDGARAVESPALKLAGDYRLKKRDWIRLPAKRAIQLVELAMSELGVRTQ